MLKYNLDDTNMIELTQNILEDQSLETNLIFVYINYGLHNTMNELEK